MMASQMVELMDMQSVGLMVASTACSQDDLKGAMMADSMDYSQVDSMADLRDILQAGKMG